MTLDPRTPVLVGAAAVSQRLDDPLAAGDALDLMTAALEAAAVDAGAPDLLRAAQVVLAPQGSWPSSDPARAVAIRVGCPQARTVRADFGILQTALFGRAAQAVADGDLDVALVAGGEAKWRDLRASIAGVELAAAADGREPDEWLRPSGRIISEDEIGVGLTNPVSQYALIEIARRAADSMSPDAHARAVAELVARFNAIAQTNPDAWNRQPMSADEIRTPGPRNRPLAHPYNKWHISQWNIDQAAGFVLCSVAAARAHGVPEDRWVFPYAVVESSHMVPVSRRPEIHRSPGFARAGAEALALSGVGTDDIAHIDLYSCFPIAVRVQAAELGLGTDRPLTVTGGMTFAGGPLNNYALQSMAKMAQVLRDDAGSLGLVTAVSGMITKQGVSLWSTRPPANSYRSADVGPAVAAATRSVTVTPPARGPGTVLTYTVVAGGGAARAVVAGDGAARAVVLVERADGTRSLAASDDAALTAAMVDQEWCGRTVELDGAGSFAAG